MIKVLLLMGLVMSGLAMGQAPKIEWSKCYGGSKNEVPHSIKETVDGGFIVVGGTGSNDGDVVFHTDGSLWVIKFDSKKNIEWQRVLGGNGADMAMNIELTSDGGYIIVGNTSSNSGDVTYNHGGADIWVIKLNSLGTIEWQNTFGGSNSDNAKMVKQTSDGGYIIVGETLSNNGDVTSNYGGFDIWVIKLNNLGTIQWQKNYGGSGNDQVYDIKQTIDNGYIIAGYTHSTDYDVIGNHGNDDAWIIKLNTLGSIEWQKTLGGTKGDAANSIAQTKDEGYIVFGSTNSYNGDITFNNGLDDVWVVKLSNLGNIEWQKAYGGTDEDYGVSGQQTSDGGYIFTAVTSSSNGDITFNHGNKDFWIVKITDIGNIVWQKSIGGSDADWSSCIQQIRDNGYLLCGYTNSNDGDVIGYHSNNDFWLVKISADNPLIKGQVFLDPNSNATHDTLEPYKSNVKVQLSNGNYTFTDNNGYYQIQTDSIGSYTLTVTPPTGYNALPASVTYSFTSYDTTVTKDIALQPATVIDSVAINVIPMVMNAVQGGAMPYWVEYTNAGTTTLSPTVALTYNNYLLAYDSCNDANATPISNGVVTAALNMQPGTTKNFVSYFTVKPSANVGDTLTTVYSITTPSINQTDSFYMIIEGGVAPPNAQRATQSITTAQVASGKDIVYTIGFKNTGSDTAYNVVITDTLSNLLKANTVQILSSSHTCKATVKGNIVTFELLNIKLPKATTNNLKSMGFVSFKVKPQTTLVAGNIITNKTNTYYNYRTPQSSIATTIVKNVITPVRITNYEASPTPPKEGLNNWTVLNKWVTSTEINTSHFNIQRSEDARLFKTVGRIDAKGVGEYQFADPFTSNNLPLTIYYRLEIVDKDGSKTYSEVKRVTLNEKQETRNIVLFPNPAKDIVTISSKENIKEIRVVNQLGQVLQHINNIHNTSYTLHLTSYTKGVYTVQIIAISGEIKNEKLIL